MTLFDLSQLLGGRGGKSCVKSIKTNLLGENYGRNNFWLCKVKMKAKDNDFTKFR